MNACLLAATYFESLRTTMSSSRIALNVCHPHSHIYKTSTDSQSDNCEKDSCDKLKGVNKATKVENPYCDIRTLALLPPRAMNAYNLK